MSPGCSGFNKRRMKCCLLVIGKTDLGWVKEGISEYEKRLRHYLPFEIEVLPDVKRTKNQTEALQREQEGEMILRALEPSDRVVLLDERGREFTSVGFSEFLAQKMLSGIKRLVFVIGGPYGFSGAVYRRADEQLGLSKMTFSHQMVRVIFVEQLYRGMTILRGEPYHHV